MDSDPKLRKELKNIKSWIVFFMIALFLSGLTAMPAETELQFLSRCFSGDTKIGAWIKKVFTGVANTNRDYPFIAYGYDWLAFAHFVLAILFIGPLKDPIKNKWVIEFGIIASVLIIPFALIAGSFRGIPVWWRLIDCSFGLAGILILRLCLKRVNRVERSSQKNFDI